MLSPWGNVVPWSGSKKGLILKALGEKARSLANVEGKSVPSLRSAKIQEKEKQSYLSLHKSRLPCGRVAGFTKGSRLRNGHCLPAMR